MRTKTGIDLYCISYKLSLLADQESVPLQKSPSSYVDNLSEVFRTRILSWVNSARECQLQRTKDIHYRRELNRHQDNFAVPVTMLRRHSADAIVIYSEA